jgi:DNA-binding transcriptional MerR regulator
MNINLNSDKNFNLEKIKNILNKKEISENELMNVKKLLIEEKKLIDIKIQTLKKILLLIEKYNKDLNKILKIKLNELKNLERKLKNKLH